MAARFIYFLALASAVSGAVTDKFLRTKPEKGAIVVDPSGATAGSFPTINLAVEALQNTTDAQKIFIFPGVYNEQVFIRPHAGPITIQGYTKNARGYKDNEVTLTNKLSRQTPGITNNDATATLRMNSPNIRLYNLNVANTSGQARTNGQALALSAQRTDQGYYGCQFTGYQDTILSNVGRQLFAHSLVTGAVDFIFGQRATAFFYKIDIVAIGPGYITAQGRNDSSSAARYVFDQVNVTGTNGTSTTVLGRPWRPFSNVLFQNSYLSDVVKPEGWVRWDAVQSTDNVEFQEYKNYGPGANIGARVNFSSQATAPVKAADLFGKDFEKENWVDTDYL